MDIIKKKCNDYSYEVYTKQVLKKSNVHQRRQQQPLQAAVALTQDLPITYQRAMAPAREKGASNWLTSLPWEEFGICLHKGAFIDALALQYGWLPPLLQTVYAQLFSMWNTFYLAQRGFSLNSP